MTYQSNWLDVLQTGFMLRAFAGGTLVALASGVIGYFVVIRRDSFATHALAHVGFPGATAAILVGAPVNVGLMVFCVAGGLVIGALGKRVDRREVATGTVLAFATGLGALFASLSSRSAATVTNVLFGNLLAIRSGDLILFAIATAVTLAVVAAAARPLLFASINPDVAEARGVPVRALAIGFTVVLSVVVTMAISVIGTLLLFALIVTPAATALTLSARPRTTIAIAVGVAVVAVWVGLAVSAMFNLPPSFPIVTLLVIGWLAATGAEALRRSGTPSSPPR